MARHSFGDPVSDEDVLVVQGVEYPMIPVGLRAMRRLLTLRSQVNNRAEGTDISETDLDLARDIVVSAVQPDVREALIEHIEDRVSPALLVEMASAVMSSFSDQNPTQQGSSSDGSSETGPDSTAGVSPEALTPTP